MASYIFVELGNGLVQGGIDYHTTPSPGIDSLTVNNQSAFPATGRVRRDNGLWVSGTFAAHATTTQAVQSNQYTITLNPDGSLNAAPSFEVYWPV